MSAEEKRAVAVNIRGQQFRIRTDADEASMQKIAQYVDDTMAAIERRTGAVDSRDVALLTALNLAREVLELRGLRPPEGTRVVEDEGLRSLIELAESALQVGTA